MKTKAWQQFVKPESSELKTKLSPLQFEVTQEEGTERSFQNEFWDNKEAGLYVDVVSGEPLFASKDKYDSGTGWPSFTQPVDKSLIIEKIDRRLFRTRTEVRSKLGDSHLGHVFKDGPEPTGLRYCINSAALRFIPLKNLKEEGYEEFLALFNSSDDYDGISQPLGSQPEAETTKQSVILAGGCFWGMEDLLRKLPGVHKTEVGYTGGHTSNPTYETVKLGNTGHAEAILVEFDSNITTYDEILKFFFRMHDPTTKNRQGNDVGTQYRSAIFFANEAQRITAEKIKSEITASGKWSKPIVTEILPAQKFYSAEEFHQDYLEKNPGGYTCHFLRD